jgi:hypothetical protein
VFPEQPVLSPRFKLDKSGTRGTPLDSKLSRLVSVSI